MQSTIFFDAIIDQAPKQTWESLELSLGSITRGRRKRFKEALQGLVEWIQCNMSINEMDDLCGGHYNVIQVQKELKGEKNTSQPEKSCAGANLSKQTRPNS